MMRFTSITLRTLGVAATFVLSAAAGAQTDSTANPAADPRVGLGAGWKDAKSAARGMELVAHVDRPQGFFNAEKPGQVSLWNSDLAFSGNLVFQGSFNGFQVWDATTTTAPTLRTTLICPGGQGDLSVFNNLLFMSVEETRGRGDCGAQGVTDTVSAERFRGVRIFDISDVDHPKQVADVQTCRGSHTHTLVSDPKDPNNIYVYVSGTGVPRSGSELAGCSNAPAAQDTSTSLFRIDVIRVPLARPQDAKIVSQPRIFADSSGRNIASLQQGGYHGDTATTQKQSETNRCHDITAFSELGLAAGACAGNGILLDIRDPAHPHRVAEVSDPNFAFWHSATFTNDGRKLLFTDEWGGGTQPRCQATDRPQWGADAIYTLTSDRKLQPAGYYKLPAPQTATENCVAHNGSLVPVPGRDIMVQAWYQGGISVFDFTDPAHPKEIAYFDRGPLSATELQVGGYWGAYWYNGRVYGSEMARGLDIFRLTPNEQLSANEIAAAELVRVARLNPQDQKKIVWPASFVVARAYIDQLGRNAGASEWAARIGTDLDRAEKMTGARQKTALTQLASQLDRDAATSADAARMRALAASVRQLAGRK
jgi:hypothetical protein